MVNARIGWSARNKFLVVIMTVFITLAGVYAVLKTPLDALPPCARHLVEQPNDRCVGWREAPSA